MTNTEATEIDILVCTECMLLICNGDDSSSDVADAESRRMELSFRWAGYLLVILNAEDGGDMGFSHGECDGCGGPAGDRYATLATKLEV